MSGHTGHAEGAGPAEPHSPRPSQPLEQIYLREERSYASLALCPGYIMVLEIDKG